MLPEFFVVLLAGLACGFVDAVLGMGYGVTSATVLVSFGIAPAIASASVHTSEAFVDIASAVSHHKLGNVRKDLLIPLLSCGTVGAVLGAIIISFIALKAAKPIVSSILLVMGLMILIKFIFRLKKVKNSSSSSSLDSEDPSYSKKKLGFLSFIAGFIDASGGGGWGPILTPTFVATGSNPRKAVGTVEFTEPIVSFFTFITFGIILGFKSFIWSIVVPMLIGGLILSPVAAWITKKTPRRWLGILVGLWVAVLNARTLLMALI